MPHIRILKALGMTAEEWGKLPPETEAPDRNNLKKKAMDIIAHEEGEANDSLEARVQALEEHVFGEEAPQRKKRRKK